MTFNGFVEYALIINAVSRLYCLNAYWCVKTIIQLSIEENNAAINAQLVLSRRPCINLEDTDSTCM